MQTTKKDTLDFNAAAISGLSILPSWACAFAPSIKILCCLTGTVCPLNSFLREAKNWGPKSSNISTCAVGFSLYVIRCHAVQISIFCTLMSVHHNGCIHNQCSNMLLKSRIEHTPSSNQRICYKYEFLSLSGLSSKTKNELRKWNKQKQKTKNEFRKWNKQKPLYGLILSLAK